MCLASHLAAPTALRLLRRTVNSPLISMHRDRLDGPSPDERVPWQSSRPAARGLTPQCVLADQKPAEPRLTLRLRIQPSCGRILTRG